MSKQTQIAESIIGITPVHVLAGLRSSDRCMLATFLALFDDGALMRRLQVLTEKTIQTVSEQAGRANIPFPWNPYGGAQTNSPEQAAKELRSRVEDWNRSPYHNDVLRLLLWIRLREALHLPPRLSASMRGTQGLADDVAAALINALDPPGLIKSGRRWLHKKEWLEQGVPALTLEDIVVPVLDELLEENLQRGGGTGEAQLDQENRRRQLKETLTAFKQFGPDQYADHLQRTGANRANDTAILITALLGGGLGALGATVSAMGFGAYILAAQASAFIPLVSGPGLVSFVSVLTNPITILALVGGGGWMVARSAKEKAEVAVASRVISLLALNGLKAESTDQPDLLRVFSSTLELNPAMGINDPLIYAYRNEWGLLGPAWEKRRNPPKDPTLDGMRVPLDKDKPGVFRTQSGSGGIEGQNAAALGTLTVGDALYSYAAIAPLVIAAMDFSRAVDIKGRLDFAELAQIVLESSPASVIGGTANLKGYVAEFVIAEQLLRAGHTVSFPEASNAPGWDLLVDGEKFQVKFHATMQGIQSHFKQYDYPVIANTELQGQIPDDLAGQVFFVDGVSNGLVDQVTRDSLAAGAALLGPAPIQFAGIITLARGTLAYQQGRMTARQALEQVLLDGSVRTGLFAVGGVLGASAGLMVFGPAGAWVFGAGAPVLAQTQTPRVVQLLKQHAKGQTYQDWETQAHARLDELGRILIDALGKKRDQLRKKIPKRDNEALAYINWRLDDDDRFLLESVARLRNLTRKKWALPEQRLTEYLRCIADCGVHPFLYQNTLQSAQLLISARPSLPHALRDMYQNALSEGKRIADASPGLAAFLKNPAVHEFIGNIRTTGNSIMSKTGKQVTATIEIGTTFLKKRWKRDTP